MLVEITTLGGLQTIIKTGTLDELKALKTNAIEHDPLDEQPISYNIVLVAEGCFTILYVAQ